MVTTETGRADSFRAVRPPRAPERLGPAARRRRQSLIAWVFALPFVLIFGFFMLVPLFSSFVLSFTDFTSKDVRNPLDVGFVGLDQFAELFGNQQFLRSLLNTGYFVVVGIPLTMAVGLAFSGSSTRQAVPVSRTSTWWRKSPRKLSGPPSSADPT